MNTIKLSKARFGLAEFAGVGTWLLVFGISLYWLSSASADFQAQAPLMIIAMLIYLSCFILMSRANQFAKKQKNSLLILTIQLLSSYLLIWFFPIDFLPILTIIWISLVSYLLSLKKSVIVMLVVVFVWFLIERYHWHQAAMVKGLLYTSFHFFAIMMSHQTKLAQQATEKSNQLNAELLTTQNLLSQASRLNERTRIARDLHDLLGHHMTALIINLQVISHQTQGDVQNKVDQCHSLSKLLLSDIREAVTSLRQNHQLDFKELLSSVAENVPRLKIESNIEIDFELDDIDLVRNILSIIQEAITNSLKHSDATQFDISIKIHNQRLELQMTDNGHLNKPLVLGNGLKGMQERVKDLEGEIKFDLAEKKLLIEISIPFQKVAN